MTQDFEIKVSFKEASFRRMFDPLVNKAIPKTTMFALNATAFEARSDIRKTLDDTFTIRKGDHLGRGMWVTRASERRLTAYVGNIRHYARMHVTGENKLPRLGRFVAVPINIRKSHTSKIPLSRLPGKLKQKKGVYTIPRPRGRMAMMQRKTKGKGKRRTITNTLLYWLVPNARIKKAWKLRAEVNRSVAKHWSRIAAREMDKTIRKLSRS